MRARIAPKIVIRVSTVLTLTACLVSASFSSGHYEVNTCSAFGMESGRATQESASQGDDRPLSPRLSALRDRIKSGDREALDIFWKEIEARGAPIVEELPGNDRDVLVTILWRATAETKNVFVFRVGDVNKPMVQLLDTDLWYKTFQFHKGARFIYQLATNLPDPKEWGGIIRFASALRNDPLNPLQYVERADEFNPYEVITFSALELPSPSRRCGPSSSLRFLLDECSVTSSSANSSATNAQFGFILRTATGPTRSLMVCWCYLTVVSMSTRRTSPLLSIT